MMASKKVWFAAHASCNSICTKKSYTVYERNIKKKSTDSREHGTAVPYILSKIPFTK